MTRTDHATRSASRGFRATAAAMSLAIAALSFTTTAQAGPRHGHGYEQGVVVVNPQGGPPVRMSQREYRRYLKHYRHGQHHGYHGHKHRHGHKKHKRKNNDAAAAIALGVGALALGAIIAGSASQQGHARPVYRNHGNRPQPYTGAWYRYCAKKYRSFDAASGTFLGYDGVRKLCR